MPPFLLAAPAVTTHPDPATIVVAAEKQLQFKRRNCNKRVTEGHDLKALLVR
jgi:hypothetical protein